MVTMNIHILSATLVVFFLSYPIVASDGNHIMHQSNKSASLIARKRAESHSPAFIEAYMNEQRGIVSPLDVMYQPKPQPLRPIPVHIHPKIVCQQSPFGVLHQPRPQPLIRVPVCIQSPVLSPAPPIFPLDTVVAEELLRLKGNGTDMAAANQLLQLAGGAPRVPWQ